VASVLGSDAMIYIGLGPTEMCFVMLGMAFKSYWGSVKSQFCGKEIIAYEASVL